MAEISAGSAALIELREAMKQRRAALITMDLVALDRILDPTLRYTHSNGVCEDKAGYLAALSRGDYVYHQVEETDSACLDLAGGIWCAGQVHMHATVKTVQRQMRNQFLAVWRRTPEGLRLAAYCATPIP